MKCWIKKWRGEGTRKGTGTKTGQMYPCDQYWFLFCVECSPKKYKHVYVCAGMYTHIKVIHANYEKTFLRQTGPDVSQGIACLILLL